MRIIPSLRSVVKNLNNKKKKKKKICFMQCKDAGIKPLEIYRYGALEFEREC